MDKIYFVFQVVVISKILFDELAHMLKVEFVRNGQYTVVPFPIKYLNEHIRFCEKDDSFEEES